MKHPSFVIGCSACLGHEDHEEDDLGGPVGYDFGYPRRDWAVFKNGGDLLIEAGEEEVRARLRVVRPPLPFDGDAAECAERLLLHVQGVRTPEALLAASNAAALRHRLHEVGLSCDGQPLECAQRLLFLLENKPLRSLKLWDAREALRPPQHGRQRLRRHNRKGKKLQGEGTMEEETEIVSVPLSPPQSARWSLSYPFVTPGAIVLVISALLFFFMCSTAIDDAVM